ncbi:hypothetical protein IW136_002309 [Coemansia sp. RSA 678]|nr:hypothetical protein IW136_002309 [Coemansia sp. RSA 678]
MEETFSVSHHYRTGGTHIIELYLDFACPFSARMWHTVYSQLVPEYRDFGLIFRHQIQPWHPSSLAMHEAALAVARLSPHNFWLFCDALFTRQSEFFDEAVVDLTRTQVYGRLADIAMSVNAVDDRLELLQLLDVQASDTPTNAGNAVTANVKYYVRMGRTKGVHMSPTVFIDGERDDNVSSSWTVEQWASRLNLKH